MSCEAERIALDNADAKLHEMDDRLIDAVDDLTLSSLSLGSRLDAWDNQFNDVRDEWFKAIVVRVNAGQAYTEARAKHIGYLN